LALFSRKTGSSRGARKGVERIMDIFFIMTVKVLPETIQQKREIPLPED
jgi:hypothetical protein